MSNAPRYVGLMAFVDDRSVSGVEHMLNCFYDDRLPRDELMDINATQHGQTALSLAVKSEQLQIVQLLLEFKADPNKTYSNDEKTCLYAAVVKGNAEICQALLAHGANPDLVYASVWTPLLLASRLGRMTILELLLQYGADPNFPNSQGFTALHVAVGRDHCFVGRKLLEHGANINFQNKEGETPLMIAARRGKIKAVKLLLEFTVERQLDPYLKEHTLGNTALHEATDAGERKIGKLMLQVWPQLIVCRNFQRQTALFSSSFQLISELREGYGKAKPQRFSTISTAFVETCDVELVAESAASGDDDNAMQCHQVMLRARCPLLMELSNVCDSDNGLKRVVVPSTVCAGKALPFILEFIYSNELKMLKKIGDQLLSQIYRAADKLKIEALSTLCSTAHNVKPRCENTFAIDMKSVLFNEQLSDVCLKSGEHSLKAHRYILCDQSQYFRAMLIGNMKEAKDRVINLVLPTQYDDDDDDDNNDNNDNNEEKKSISNDNNDDEPISFVALKIILHFLYCGEFNFDEYNFQDENKNHNLIMCLFEVAHMFMLVDLGRNIELKIVNTMIDHDSACSLMSLAETFGAVFLREECFDYVVTHFDEIDDDQLTMLPQTTLDDLKTARNLQSQNDISGRPRPRTRLVL